MRLDSYNRTKTPNLVYFLTSTSLKKCSVFEINVAAVKVQDKAKVWGENIKHGKYRKERQRAQDIHSMDQTRPFPRLLPTRTPLQHSKWTRLENSCFSLMRTKKYIIKKYKIDHVNKHYKDNIISSLSQKKENVHLLVFRRKKKLKSLLFYTLQQFLYAMSLALSGSGLHNRYFNCGGRCNCDRVHRLWCIRYSWGNCQDWRFLFFA